MPELPVLPTNELVAVVEELRRRLRLGKMDLSAHSAGASVALPYTAAHPERLRRLVLVAPSTRAVGLAPAPGDVMAAVERRHLEPWYPAARAALEAQESGDQSAATQLAAAPFYYGRWDDVAREHAAREPEQRSPDAMAIFYADGALDGRAPRTERSRAALSSGDARCEQLLGVPRPVVGRQAVDEVGHGQRLVHDHGIVRHQQRRHANAGRQIAA